MLPVQGHLVHLQASGRAAALALRAVFLVTFELVVTGQGGGVKGYVGGEMRPVVVIVGA